MSVQKQKTSNYPAQQITINLKETESGWQAWDDLSPFVGEGDSAAAAVEDYARTIQNSR